MASVEWGQSPPRAGSASPRDHDPGQGALPEPRRPFLKARLVAVTPSRPGGCGRGYRKHKPCVWHTAAPRWSDLITRGGYVPGPSRAGTRSPRGPEMGPPVRTWSLGPFLRERAPSWRDPGTCSGRQPARSAPGHRGAQMFSVGSLHGGRGDPRGSPLSGP